MKNFYKTLSFAGLGILRAKHLTQLQKIEEDAHGLLQELAVRQGATPAHVKSQLGQDLFALYSLSWKRGVPAPMGFSRSSVDVLAILPSASALAASSRALHEWLGILAIRLGVI